MKKQKEIKKIIKIQAYFQILILIMGVFAFSYLISENFSQINFEKKDNKNNKLIVNLIKMFIKKITNLLFKPLIASVSAEPLEFQCCEKDNQNNICQEYISLEIEDKCSGTIFPGRCSEFENCRLGCCISDNGLCSINSPKSKCEEQGGIWKQDSKCNVLECQKACCILNDNSVFTTLKNCEKEAEMLGLGFDSWKFDNSIKTEIECLMQTASETKGACIIGENCRIINQKECINLNGDFYSGYLCSNPELSTNCERESYTSCVEGKDEVYWFDSCGNRENIYGTTYNGRIKSKQDSCILNDDLSNAKSCGNCDYFKGSICGNGNANKGDYICKDLSCETEINGKKVNKKNGESWCVYESVVGDGKDVVGSRHYRNVCLDGEVIIEPCSDYRNGICVSSESNENGEIFETSSCIINRWQECINYNIDLTGETKKEKRDSFKENLVKCEENPHCMVKQTNIDSKFNFKTCVPKYPEGFDLSISEEKGEYASQTAEAICSIGTRTCVAVKIKKVRGYDWINKDCLSAEFTNKMNELCYSLGDCGGYVNIAGEYSENFQVKGKAPKHLQDKIINLLKANAKSIGQKLKLNQEDVNYLLKGMPEVSEDGSSVLNNQELTAKAEDILMKTSGASGALLASVVGGGGIVFDTLTFGLASANFAVGFGAAAAGLAVGTATSLILTKAFGLEGQAAEIMMYLGIAAGIVIAYFYAGAVVAATAQLSIAGFLGFCFTTGFCIVAIIVLIAVAIALKVFGIGDSTTYKVTYTCLPYQPPDGGKCYLCNENELGCSEYKCKSLGKACELINKGTEEEMCVEIKDNGPPVILGPSDLITPGFDYIEISNKGFKIIDKNHGKGCVQAFTPLLFGIKTNEPAICKIDTQRIGFEEMEDYIGGNVLIYNHTGVISLPSVEGIAKEYNLTTKEVIQKYGDLTFYVKCKDAHGNVNEADYSIRMCVRTGPDKTSPYITKTEPQNNAHISHNQNELFLKIWTNEPSECKWDNKDVSFNLMKNEMICLTDEQQDLEGEVSFEGILNQELYGYPCETDIVSLKSNNPIYIRCKDQPWETNNSLRNFMRESFIYSVKETSPLSVEILKPNEDITTSTNFASIKLIAETSGGVDGKAECFYSFDNENFIRFYNTFSNKHTQEFSTLTTGNYEINIKCEDIAGNKAESSVSFEINIDNTGPIITRMYYDNGLKIIINEEGECRYSNEEMNWENQEIMNFVNGKHSASSEDIYYLNCRDEYGNFGEQRIIKPYS